MTVETVRSGGPTPPVRSTRLNHIAWLLVLGDVVSVAVAIGGALILRLETVDLAIWIQPYLPAALVPFAVQPTVLVAFGLYRRDWRYASVREILDLLNAVVISVVVLLAAFAVMSFASVPGAARIPRSFYVLEPVLFFVLAAFARMVVRTILERRAISRTSRHGDVPTLVFGAGTAGAVIARMAAASSLPGIRIVGYIDDDKRKRGSRFLGYRVHGGLDNLGEAVRRSGATQLLVAIPSGPGTPVRRAVEAAQAAGLAVKTIPPLRDLVTGRYQVEGIRSVSVEDLLRRPPVEIDFEAIGSSINGASVLVTGGGGSIGSELVRQILTLGPRVLTVLDHHEWTLWTVERDIAARRKESDGTHVVAALADVRSTSALNAVMRRARPDVVFHAAALKHVPYVELFPSEGVLTNVLGTRNVLRVCEQLGVPRFVLISTDKAVEPVSVMGATKRLAELLTVEAGHRTGQAYAAVRFGNVLGSSGSVVPLLQRQLDDGLPLTITQPDATRYFMTIAEAVSLILEAGARPAAGEVYVLDMGEPIRIMDLARDLVRLNRVDPDKVRFTVTGLRPGERLHEKLFYDDEIAISTTHAGILRAKRTIPEGEDGLVDRLVDDLAAAAKEYDDQAVRALLLQSASLGGTSRTREPITT